MARPGAVFLALSLVCAGACTPNPDRLPTPARNFYYVIEDDQQQLQYLETKSDQRQSYLETIGLWQQWTALSPEEQAAVDTGEVKVGFKAFAAHMAWGLPANVRKAEAGERTVEYETFIRCTSGPKKGQYVRNNLDCDGTSSEVQLAVEDELVTEIKYLD